MGFSKNDGILATFFHQEDVIILYNILLQSLALHILSIAQHVRCDLRMVPPDALRLCHGVRKMENWVRVILISSDKFNMKIYVSRSHELYLGERFLGLQR